MVGRPTSRPSVRLVFAMLALAGFGIAGCQFDPSGQIAADGAVPDPYPDATRPPDDARVDARAPDARAPDAREPDAGLPPDAAVLPPDGVLVDRNVLTRYFIDEANSGSNVPALLDSADPPLPLSIDYEGDGAFVEEAGNRGLRWNSLPEEDGNGRAAAPVGSDSKIRQRLDGATRATIEVVVDVDAYEDGARISHIGEEDDRGVFTLRLDKTPDRVRFVLNNSEQQQTVWDVALIGRGRTVLHLVLDSSALLATDRVRLYVDGDLQGSLTLAAPGLNEAIDIRSDNHFYVLGNTNDGERGILGTIFYAAMYTAALDAGEVRHNADILLVNDDGPGN